MALYLSTDWFEQMNEAAAGHDGLAEVLGDTQLVVAQVVTGGPEGDVTYTVRVGDGTVRFAPVSEADAGADVTIRQSWDTAVAVARGAVSAQEAFMSGRIRVAGNAGLLLQAQSSLARLDAVFAAVRASTSFGSTSGRG